MNRTRIAAVILLAALAWAGWEIHSLRQRSSELEMENVSPRGRSASGGAPRTASLPPSSAPAPAQNREPGISVSVEKLEPGDRIPRATTTIDDLLSGLPAEMQTDGSIIIGKGTNRAIVVSADEAASLSANLNKVVADARNKGPNGASYSAGKATGAPDGPNHGGNSSAAWCPNPQNGANEWLQLKYAKNVEISEVNIHETYATGALAKVTAVMPDGSERTLWEGTEPVETPPVERVLKVPPGIRADQLRITMDETRIGNWQEIDAVEIVGKDGSRQWATEATASSYWGSGSGWGRGLREDFGLEATQWSFKRN